MAAIWDLLNEVFLIVDVLPNKKNPLKKETHFLSDCPN